MDQNGNLPKAGSLQDCPVYSPSAQKLREQYHKDFATGSGLSRDQPLEERKLRRQKLQEFINKEKSPYERAKMRLRNFCAWLLHRD